MLYSDITYHELLDLKMKPIWFAKFSDHPKYTFEYVIEDIHVEDLVLLPTEAMIIEYEVVRQDYNSSSVIELEIRFGDMISEVNYISSDDEQFSVAIDYGVIIGSTYQSVADEYQRQINMLVDEYIEYNDRERVSWYVDCLEKINPIKANEYVDKHPELFI